MCKDFKGLSLIVPPGTEFEKFTNVLLPAGLTPDDFEGYQEVADFMNRFHCSADILPMLLKALESLAQDA